MVKSIRQKQAEKNRTGIDKFGIGIELELINLMWNWN